MSDTDRRGLATEGGDSETRDAQLRGRRGLEGREFPGRTEAGCSAAGQTTRAGQGRGCGRKRRWRRPLDVSFWLLLFPQEIGGKALWAG